MITAADLHTLSQATLHLYSPDLHTGNYADHAFRFLSTLTDSDMITYGDLDPKAGAMEVGINVHVAEMPEVAAAFGRFMAKYPLFCFDPKVNEGRPFFRNDFFSARQFRDLDIFQESFGILGWMNHGAVHVPTDDGRVLFFGMERTGRTDFSERDRLILQLAQSHLSNAKKLAQARQRMRDEFTLDPGVFCRAGFSARESEVAYWLTEGKTNVEMGLLMGLHVQTVKGHLTALFNKTGSGNRLALTLHLLELARTFLRSSHDVYHVPVR